MTAVFGARPAGVYYTPWQGWNPAPFTWPVGESRATMRAVDPGTHAASQSPVGGGWVEGVSAVGAGEGTIPPLESAAAHCSPRECTSRDSGR